MTRKGDRKLGSDEIKILEHVYFQLHDIQGLSQRRSLEVAGDAVYVSRDTADKYLFTYPHPKRLEELRAHRRKIQKKWRDEIKEDPKRYAEFKKKDKEKHDRWYAKIKANPIRYNKKSQLRKERWKIFYKALKNDPVKYQNYLEAKAEDSVKRYHERKGTIERLEEKFEDINTEIITVEELAKGIAHECKSRDFCEFIKNSNIVLDGFGFSNRILDNFLGQKERQLFYILEELGFVKPEYNVETNLGDLGNYEFSGKSWRSTFWHLDKNKILKSAIEYEKSFLNSYKPKSERKVKEAAIYDSEDIWSRKTPQAQV